MQKELGSYLQQVIGFHRIVVREVCGYVGAALERGRVAVMVQTVPRKEVGQLLLLYTEGVSAHAMNKKQTRSNEYLCVVG